MWGRREGGGGGGETFALLSKSYPRSGNITKYETLGFSIVLLPKTALHFARLFDV